MDQQALLVHKGVCFLRILKRPLGQSTSICFKVMLGAAADSCGRTGHVGRSKVQLRVVCLKLCGLCCAYHLPQDLAAGVGTGKWGHSDAFRNRSLALVFARDKKFRNRIRDPNETGSFLRNLPMANSVLNVTALQLVTFVAELLTLACTDIDMQ